MLPFLLCLLIIGFPMFFLEASLSQFSGRATPRVWSFCPMFKGWCNVMSWTYSLPTKIETWNHGRSNQISSWILKRRVSKTQSLTTHCSLMQPFHIRSRRYLVIFLRSYSFRKLAVNPYMTHLEWAFIRYPSVVGNRAFVRQWILGATTIACPQSKKSVISRSLQDTSCSKIKFLT